MRKKRVLSDKGNFRSITALTIVAHSMVRAKKGKRPSMGYCGILNPRDAYKKATSLICNAREMFHICDLMALFTGKHISPSGMDIFHDGIHFLRGKRPQTKDFAGDLLDQVRDHLATELPFLKEIEIPEIRSQEEAVEWSQLLEKKYGAFHEISRMEKPS